MTNTVRRMVLTTYEPRRRWYGRHASRYRLEFRVRNNHDPSSFEVCLTIAGGWMPPQNFHVYELIDITPAPADDVKAARAVLDELGYPTRQLDDKETTA